MFHLFTYVHNSYINHAQLFDDVTKIFSTAEVPLIVDVIPTLEELREGMIAARDDQVNKVSNTIRVACQAGILLIDKYSTFTNDCEIYIIAIGTNCLSLCMPYVADNFFFSYVPRQEVKMV